MTAKYRTRIGRPSIKTIALAAIGLTLSACAPNRVDTPVNEQAAAIQRLKVVRSEDSSKVEQSDLENRAQPVLYLQGDGADTAITEIRRGYPVARSEIARTSLVPDVSLTAEQQGRAQLMQKLADAEALADHGAHDYGDNPFLTESFRQQRHLIESIMDRVGAEKDVPAYEIQGASHSPVFP